LKEADGFYNLIGTGNICSWSFGGTHQNLCPAISGILRAHLHVLLEKVNYYTVLLDCFEVLGGWLLLFREKNMKARWYL
jgi:hypothetical protein